MHRSTPTSLLRLSLLMLPFGPILFGSIAIGSIGLAPTPARASSDIAGIWLGHDRDGHVEIKPCGVAMCGYIVSILDKTLPPNPPDYYNEDPELRSRPICGLQVLGDLKKENDEWDGWVYDPRRGKTFYVDVKLQDPNTLMVHGYLALKLMGETKLWTRAGNNIQRCSRPPG
jgi:uncharacterized protein (DUF2147 family)